MKSNKKTTSKGETPERGPQQLEKACVELLVYNLMDFKNWNSYKQYAFLFFLGKCPHVSICVHGHEFEVEQVGPLMKLFEQEENEGPPKRPPHEPWEIGTTEKSFEEVKEIFENLAENRFRKGSYNLLTNNCINFADAMCMELCGVKLKSHYRWMSFRKAARAMTTIGAITFLGLVLLL